jgi:glyoxylase-like metal-dependent hydrolase (beta-lactamase superfamily II)
MMRILFLMTALLMADSALAKPDFTSTQTAPGNMRFAWIHGSVSAKANTDVRIQVHRYNEHTYILRQNPATHWEAPFMYLLFGERQVVLIDAGATSNPDYFPIRDTVDALIERWQVANEITELQLIVLPLGAEQSQIEGLSQFDNRRNTKILSPTDKGRSTLMNDQDRSTLDMGGRNLTLIKTPGINAHAISVYDPWADLMFTGTTFYAGRLVIRDFDAYKDSLKRLVTFSNEQAVKWIMGGRIEMSDYPGMDYRLRSNYRPREHSLQMSVALLTESYDIVHLINGKEDIRIHNDFIVMNGVGRGARDYGWPTYTPERFRQVRLR